MKKKEIFKLAGCLSLVFFLICIVFVQNSVASKEVCSYDVEAMYEVFSR